MRLGNYLKEAKTPLKKGVKGYNKEWEKFEKAAKREIGQNWNGNVTGDIIAKLSSKAKQLYSKYFDSLNEAKEMIEIMVGGPRSDHGYSKKNVKSGEMITMKIIKKHKGKIIDVTDKNTVIVELPPGNLNVFKQDMSNIDDRGLKSNQFSLFVKGPRRGDGFDEIML